MAEEQPIHCEVRYCVPDDQARHLPARRRHPQPLPPGLPLPGVGDVVYLSSSSAWAVTMVVHEWLTPVDLHIQLWLEHVGSARMRRPPGFELTQ